MAVLDVQKFLFSKIVNLRPYWSFAFQNAKNETLELGRQINLSEDGSRYEYGLCALTVRTMRTTSVDYSHYKRRLCTREVN